jgi:uncharacterized protein (TIGR01589 family)
MVGPKSDSQTNPREGGSTVSNALNGENQEVKPEEVQQRCQDNLKNDVEKSEGKNGVSNGAQEAVSGQGKKPGSTVSAEDIQMVQNLIERCLQLYLTKEEVISVLREQATIDPEFTQLIWSKLEEQNPDFFRCYYTRLKLKAQIVMFNHLLEQQVQVVQKVQRGWLGSHGSATASGIPLFQGGVNSDMHLLGHGGSFATNSTRDFDSMFDTNRSSRENNHRMGATPDPAMQLYSAETGGPSPLGHFNTNGNDYTDLGILNSVDKSDHLKRNWSLSDLEYYDSDTNKNMDASK